MTLQELGIKNRDMKLSSIGKKDVDSIIDRNIEDFQKILQWNVDNNILLYRMPVHFPFISHPKFGYSVSSKHQTMLKDIGDAYRHKIRITTHPSHFVCLASPNEKTVANSILDLERHAEIFDALGLEKSHWNPINIHVGGTYGDKESALNRFYDVYQKMTDSVRTRLVVENDDKTNMYSTAELVDFHRKSNIPVTFDYLHHKILPGNLSEKEAFNLAYDTWDCTPVFHYSESNPAKRISAHSDYIEDEIITYDREVYIEIEAKAKELALIKYRNKYC